MNFLRNVKFLVVVLVSVVSAARAQHLVGPLARVLFCTSWCEQGRSEISHSSGRSTFWRW